jgi:hypothetical protein
MRVENQRLWLPILLSKSFLLCLPITGTAQTDRQKAAQEKQARLDTATSCARTVALLASPAGASPLLALSASKWDEWLEPYHQWVAGTPEITVKFSNMVVYKDALTIQTTITNHATEAIRIDVPFTGRRMRGFPFRTRSDEIWEIAPWGVHVCQFNPPKESETPLVEPEGSITVECVIGAVDGGPMLRPLKKREETQLDKRPDEMTYEYRFFFAVRRKDREAKQLNVKEIGKGTVNVEWKDELMPGDLRTRVIESPRTKEWREEPRLDGPVYKNPIRRLRPFGTWRFLRR